MVEESLKRKTLKGTFWSAADAFLGQGVSFVVGIVLARMLSPEEYGLVGIVLIFTTILSGVVDSGFSRALIRKLDTSDDDYNTMFITNMATSLLMFVLLFFCAPYISLFFSRPELTAITQVMGLILIFQALSITQTTILTKRIDFKTKTKASVVSALLSGIVGITMAYMGVGVWSLVGQRLSATLVYTISMWILIKWWPRLRFNVESFHYMWGFGWKLMISGLLDNTWNQLYQVVVGKCYSPATLGQYSRSKEYASLLSTNFTTIIQRVSYPVLAEVQNDEIRMLIAYRKMIKITMFVTTISLIPLGAISDPFLYCLIGPQWHEAASYLPLICISMSLYPLHAMNLNMLQVLGRSDIFLYLEIVKKAIAILPLCLGMFVGIYWMLVGSILVGFISFFLNSYYSGKIFNYSSWMQLKDVAPSYCIAIVISLAVFFLKYLPLSYWIVLPLQLLIGIVLFVSICNFRKPEEYKELLSILKPYIHFRQK